MCGLGEREDEDEDEEEEEEDEDEEGAATARISAPGDRQEKRSKCAGVRAGPRSRGLSARATGARLPREQPT